MWALKLFYDSLLVVVNIDPVIMEVNQSNIFLTFLSYPLCNYSHYYIQYDLNVIIFCTKKLSRQQILTNCVSLR